MILIRAVLSALCLFFAVLGCLRLGWALGRRRLLRAGEDGNAGLGAVDAAVFGLMGLLLAFTFTGAAGRFDHRRDLITSEVNAIGTAWLRLDLLEAHPRDELRELFRQYVDGRMSIYRDVTDGEINVPERARVAVLQQKLWERLQSAIADDGRAFVPPLLLTPVNEMFDVAETRYRATQQHPPFAIYVMLALLVLVSALLAGFGMAKAERQSVLHMIGFAATTAVAVYLIIDLEYPRMGIVRVDSFDQAMLDLRASMQ